MNDESFLREEAEQYFREAYDYQIKGKFEEAVTLYRKSIHVFPTAEAHTFLGWAFSMQGLYDEAINECRKAIEIDPDFGNPYNDIGAYLIEKGKDNEAFPWFEKALKAKRYESYCYPHYNMGRLWEKKGDWDKALKCYRDAVIENSGYSLAKRAINRVLGLYN